MDSVTELNAKINQLQMENKYLKSLLDKAGINYQNIEKDDAENLYDPNQGTRILKRNITPEDADDFFRMFWGRTDVYSKRSVKKSTGEAGYYTQCHNFWKNGCHRKNGSKIRCKECSMQAYKKLERIDIIKHLQGESENGSDVVGVYPLFPNGNCRFIVFDFDNHEKGAEKHDFANTDDAWKEEVATFRKICEMNEVDVLVERSRSGQGAHVWLFFEEEINAALARKFGFALLRKGSESVNLKSFQYYDRMLPMQEHVPADGLGNLIALPLQGQSLKDGNSAFVDENWNAYPDQWKELLGKQKLSQAVVEEKLREWGEAFLGDKITGKQEEIFSNDGEMPWAKTRGFLKDDVDGKIHITLADGIYVDTVNLAARIQNRIRELAAFSNPMFYRNQAIGLSNFDKSRIIYLGNDERGYVKIPRGLLDKLVTECRKAGIEYEIFDERCSGRTIHVSFNGKLKESQVPAVENLLKHDTGILHAATAFGKTVVCCNIIAEKKVNTLILLQSSSLMEQWKNALEEFLVIEEEFPEYETASGRKKKRTSLIGKLQASHDSTTGIIDIAMAGSVCKKGEYHKRLKEYGLVIVDECHHTASDTILGIMQQVKAKYVYGVTATPTRSDGLEKINYMLLGPIRYQYSAKERAKEQGISHFVYPRFTRAVAPRFATKKMHPNEAYELLRNNKDRDDMIVSDVIKCINEKRTPIVLSKYVDHSERLYERLKTYADYVFFLSGHNSKKEYKSIMEQMRGVKAEESMILIATGKLVGEGFDFPRFDTLIMATPVSWKGVVEQYAGRLNRDYEGKESVIIYDYIDSHITMFDNMYHKRLKAYQQIGYEILGNDAIKEKAKASEGNDQIGENAEIETIRSIYDIDNYRDVFNRDLISADKEIVISSPAISGAKVSELIELLKGRQESGIKVIIVTWRPDCYGYGDSSYWMELHERMRRNGFHMNLVEDYCEHYCILDREIVWYGSMNFLGKEDSEDNLMRVCNKEIATELLELTFGKGKYEGEEMI